MFPHIVARCDTGVNTRVNISYLYKTVTRHSIDHCNTACYNLNMTTKYPKSVAIAEALELPAFVTVCSTALELYGVKEYVVDVDKAITVLNSAGLPCGTPAFDEAMHVLDRRASDIGR